MSVEIGIKERVEVLGKRLRSREESLALANTDSFHQKVGRQRITVSGDGKVVSGKVELLATGGTTTRCLENTVRIFRKPIARRAVQITVTKL